MLGQLVTCAVSLALLAPWCLSAAWLLNGALIERVAVGGSLGLAVSVCTAYLLGAVHRLDSFVWVYAGGCLLATIVGWQRRWRRSPRVACEPLPNSGPWFVPVFAIAIVAALVPTLSSRAPIGWDPAFHAILAEKVRLANGLVYDWQPFESIPLNYPLGSHVWVALVASLVREPVHYVFQVQHVVIHVLACLLVYALALRMFRCANSAVFALACYGLIGDWGTFYSYYQWGGLPTEMGLALFVGVVWLVLTQPGWPARALGAVLLGAIALVHHLSALIAVLVLGSYCLLSLWARARDGVWQRIAQTGLLAAFAFAWFVVPYARRALHLQGTQVLQLVEEPRLSLATLVWNLGPWIVAGAALGLWRARAQPGAALSFTFAWIAALFAAYFGLDYGYRLIALLRDGQDITAFTASRMATALAYPLCIAAGHGCEQARLLVLARLPKGLLERSEGSSVAVCLCAASLLTLSHGVTLSRRTAYAPVAEAACAWVREHAPHDALVVYESGIAPRRWIPFLTWRASMYSPIPASEDRAAVERKYRELLAHPSELSTRVAKLDKRAYRFSLAADGTPRLERIP